VLASVQTHPPASKTRFSGWEARADNVGGLPWS